MSDLNVPQIDIPFEHRHTCWVCAEPSEAWLQVPSDPARQADCPHPPLSVPVCKECAQWAKQPQWRANDVTAQRAKLKQALSKAYQRHLDIGNNWTEQELAESEFEDKVFGGFKKSAWLMFEIARDRVEFAGWPLAISGVDLTINHDVSFEFDGISYQSVAEAIAAHAQQLNIMEAYLTALINKLGKSRFKAALHYARRHPTFDAAEIPQLLAGIK